MQVIKAPNPLPFEGTCIFLAGTIDMGASEDWQSKVADGLKHIPELIVLNPRRDDWDSSWVQSVENLQFARQVNWELGGIHASKLVLFYFAPGSQSPVTMTEFGLVAGKFPSKAVVCCPEGFWRKGNIDVMCKRYDIKTVDTLEDLIEFAKNSIKVTVSIDIEL